MATQAPTRSAQASAPVVAAPGPTLDTPSLVAKVKASVVNITVESSPSAQDAAMSPFEFFRRNEIGRAHV